MVEPGGLAEHSMDPVIYEQLVKFLKNNGLTNTEKILRKEAAELNIGEEANPNASIPSTSSEDLSKSGILLKDIIAEYCKAGFSESLMAEQSEYSELVNFADTAFDHHRVELSVLLFPVFAHLYLKAVRAGHQIFAKKLMNSFEHSIPHFYKEQVSELKWITTPLQTQTSELADALLANTFLLKLSKPVLKQIEGFLNRHQHIQEIVSEHITLEVVDQPIRVQSSIATELGGLLGQRSKHEKKHKMLYGLLRDELVSLGNDKKRQKLKEKDSKKKDANAPATDRIPLPALPENIKSERKLALRDSQLKKTRISAENPPSVCLYTVLNANNGLCSASISENCAMLALGFGNSTIQVNALASDELKALKPAKELEQLDNDNEDFFDEMYEGGEKTKSITLLGHSGPVHSVSFSCERRLLLSGSRDSTIRLWNLEMRRNLVIYRTVAPVWQAQFCNRGYYFAAATADQTVSLWATDRIQPIRIFADASADVTCLDFHPNSNYIASGSDDRYVRVWDVLTGTCVRTFSGHKGAVKSVKVSPCGRYLVSASTEGQIAVWDLAQQKLLGTQCCEPINFNVPIVFSRDSSVFAMGTPSHGLSFFSMETMTSTNSFNNGGISTGESMNEPRINPIGFTMFSYPTKRTSILDCHFTRKNTVVAVGVFNQ